MRRTYKRAFKPTNKLLNDIRIVDKTLTKEEKVFLSVDDDRPEDSDDIIYREVLYIDKKPAAYCELYDETLNRAWVAICVGAEYRGMDYSTILLDRMFKTVEDDEFLKDKRFIWLVNRENSKSISLAKRYGFKTTNKYKRLKYR